MSRPLCSVVFATFNRARLLARSLHCYRDQDFPRDQFELVVVDDHSTDNTAEMVKQFCCIHDIQYTLLTTGPKREVWRDCGSVLNAGIRASRGEYILLTHPEVMVGRGSVVKCVDVLERFEHNQVETEFSPLPYGLYACCKPYYLSPRDQERLDTVDWLTEGPLAVRKIEGFYDLEQHNGGNPDYTPQCIEKVGTPEFRHTHWLSWVFGGCSRATWKRLGGMLETSKWGSVDVGWMHRRRTVGIANVTLTDDNTLCCHQNHDGPGNTPTPRIEDEWKKELAGLPLDDPQQLVYPAVDNLGW